VREKMKSKINLHRFIKYAINAAWYGAIIIGTVLLIAVIFFDYAVITNKNVNSPTLSVRMNNFVYKFNTQYIEVNRIDGIITEHVNQKILKSGPYSMEAISSLYKLNIADAVRYETTDSAVIKYPNKLMAKNAEMLLIGKSFFPINEDEIDHFPVLWYFAHKNLPSFAIGFTFYIIITSLFALIIIFNLRQIFLSVSTKSLFTKENAVRIKFIAVYALLGEITRIVIYYFINHSIANKGWYFTLKSIYPIKYSFNLSWADINYELIFIAIIFFLFAGIIQLGSSMKEELDLTV
jgi:hypothetical protein